MAVIQVALGGRSYEVKIASGLLSNAAQHLQPFLRKRRVPVIADRAAWQHHGPHLQSSLQELGHDTSCYIIEPGEMSKSWSELEKLTDWLLAQGVERGDNVLAFGGGVVGDLAGFACSILKRGCGFVQIPSTLLAQVDSSVGGKTAINTKAGKNLIGAFHQPSLVLADLDTLATLPDRELRAGYAEIVKYGILGDRPFFEWCEGNSANVLSCNAKVLEYAVAKSVEAKARIVAEDERELSGARALLNLGHTFGHALEAELGFGNRLLHGEAVALGMVLAARYSVKIGQLRDNDAHRITRAMDQAGLPSEISALGLTCTGATLVDHMHQDKKMDAGTLPFILLSDIGAAYLDRDISLDDIARFLDAQLQEH